MNFLGIDNGVSGTVAVIREDGSVFVSETPVMKVQDFNAAKKHMNRVEVPALRRLLREAGVSSAHCVIESPMINPGKFNATLSAVRALEATLIVLEELRIHPEFVSSRTWQHALLPAGTWKKVPDKNGRPVLKADPADLKFAGVALARRLFPKLDLDGFKDADGLMIAEYCRRKRTGRL